MEENDPRHVIIDYICQPQGPVIEEKSVPIPSGEQGRPWRAVTRAAGGMGAKASTIQFLQQRSIPDRQLHLVSFEDEEGQLNSWLCCVFLEPSGHWHFAGGTNINRSESMPKSDYPWANLAGLTGDWHTNLFWAGGRVLDNGLNVAGVHLVAKNGVVLEDTVQDGIVMFVSNKMPPMPVQVELYDGSGKLVGTHPYPRRLPTPLKG